MTKSSPHPQERQQRGSGACLSTEDGEIVKRQTPSLSAMEHFRTLAGQRVALETGLFVVPKILSFDESEGIIRFERIRTMVPLYAALCRHTDAEQLISITGVALAAIHMKLEVPHDAVRIQDADYEIEQPYKPVPLHGDFGTVNIFATEDLGGIIIIDWMNAHWRPGIDASMGPAAIDLGAFLITLFYRRPLGRLPIRNIPGLARVLLREYQSHSSEELDLALLRTVTLNLARRHATIERKRNILRSFAYRPSLWELRAFLGKVCRKGL